MKPTTVTTDELIEKLKENRAKHEKEFKKARKIWLKRAIKQLRKIADRAEQGQRLTTESFNPLGKYPKPISYLESYDVMISRLEAEVGDTVELDDREFRSYWLDEWDWKGQFIGTTSLYNNA